MNYNRKDAFYRQAKEEGYRSRAAYKLIELNKRLKVLRGGVSVLDLGCWPGGWVQVAAKLVGPKGMVVGVDLKEVDPLNMANVITVIGDASDADVQQKLREGNGSRQFDVVLSDMSPKISGIREADQAGALHVVELAASIAEDMLAPGGGFVAKAFPSSDLDRFVKSIQGRFQKLQRISLDSTRKTSKEFYLAGVGFRGR